MGSSCVKIHTWPFRRGSKVVNNGDITSTLITKPNGKRLSSSTSTNLGCSHHVQLRIEVYHQNASPALPPCKQQHETHPSSSPLHTNTNTTPPSESSPFWFGNEDPVHTRCILEHYAEELLEVRKPNSRAPVQFVGQVKRLKLQHKKPLSTLDEVSIYQRDIVPMGSPMTRLRIIIVITTWDASDGIPLTIQRYDDPAKWHKLSADSTPFTLYCLPVFMAQHDFEYSSTQGSREVGYACAISACVHRSFEVLGLSLNCMSNVDQDPLISHTADVATTTCKQNLPSDQHGDTKSDDSMETDLSTLLQQFQSCTLAVGLGLSCRELVKMCADSAQNASDSDNDSEDDDADDEDEDEDEDEEDEDEDNNDANTNTNNKDDESVHLIMHNAISALVGRNPNKQK